MKVFLKIWWHHLKNNQRKSLRNSLWATPSLPDMKFDIFHKSYELGIYDYNFYYCSECTIKLITAVNYGFSQ